MKTSNMSPSPFTFINITNTTHIDEDKRDIIRTQAITDYHYRKRTNNPRDTNPKTSQVRGRIGKFKLRTKGLEPTTGQSKHLRKTVQAQSVIPGHRVFRRGRDEALVIGSERKPRLRQVTLLRLGFRGEKTVRGMTCKQELRHQEPRTST
jgi:hypothetical protein